MPFRVHGKTRNVRFWTLFYRYKPCWSLAPKNNIYKCIFVWRQLLSVYNGGIHHRRKGGHAGEQEQKTKLLFHVNSVKNSFIVLSISMATFVMWLKKDQSILCVRVLSSSEASFRLSQHNTGSLIR